jgi:hypothetical protein
MSKLLVVEGDPVDGTDVHNVTGTTTSSPPAAYTGTGDYAYKGEVSGGLSDLVTVDGTAIAVVTSSSDLRADGAPEHQAARGSQFNPAVPAPNPTTLVFDPAPGIGTGKPNGAAGSDVVTVDGAKALLDADKFDTCGIPGGTASASAAANTQSFVTCSE